jgi:hypothetical protein
VGVAVATCCGAVSVAAQAGTQVKDERVWSLVGLRTGFCVRFLTDPGMAPRELSNDLRLLRADQDRTLHPALRQVIETQPEFASWVPSNLCFYYSDAVNVGNQRVAERDARKAQMLGVWSLGAVEQGTGNRRDLVLDLLASRERLRRVAAANLVQLHDADAAFRAATDTSPEQYTLTIKKTRLVWSGRATGDSTRVEAPLVDSWRVPGVRGVTWSARLALTPAWSRGVVGSFSVEGKGDLAKVLKASPIRFVGPFYRGGKGELGFSR